MNRVAALTTARSSSSGGHRDLAPAAGVPPAQVVSEVDQLPLDRHPLQSAEGRLPEAERLFDKPKAGSTTCSRRAKILRPSWFASSDASVRGVPAVLGNWPPPDGLVPTVPVLVDSDVTVDRQLVEQVSGEIWDSIWSAREANG